jgi:hypothetical protein
MLKAKHSAKQAAPEHGVSKRAAKSARVETLEAFHLLEILNAADIIGKIVLITEYRYCGRSTGGNAI